MERQAIEKNFLRHVDEAAARVRRKLDTTGFQDLAAPDHSDWVRFLMSLRLRQPDVVQKIRTEASERLETALRDHPQEYEALAEASDPATMVEWVNANYPGLIENYGMSLFHKLVGIPEVGQTMIQMRWMLWEFPREPHDLVLSDRPCIFTEGIEHPDLIIALPIGPRKAFVAAKSERAAAILRRQRGRDLVMRINESSINQARARVYARNDSPRRFIRNRMPLRRTL